MGHGEVYTPQDRRQRPRRRRRRRRRRNARNSPSAPTAARPARGLRLEPGAVTIGAGSAPPQGADVWLARYDPKVVEVAVRRGENAGRTLAHKDVVRQMILLGHWSGEAERLALPPASHPGLAEAVLVQADRRRPDPRRGEGLSGADDRGDKNAAAATNSPCQTAMFCKCSLSGAAVAAAAERRGSSGRGRNGCARFDGGVRGRRRPRRRRSGADRQRQRRLHDRRPRRQGGRRIARAGARRADRLGPGAAGAAHHRQSGARRPAQGRQPLRSADRARR